MTVTRATLAEAAYKAGDMSRNEASDFVDATLKAIADALVAGEAVKLPNFGSFSTRRKQARMGRNPKRPEEGGKLITARTVVVFKPSGALKDDVRTGLERVPAAGKNWFAKAKLRLPK